MTRYIATIAMEVRFAVSPIAASATMASFTLTATVVVVTIQIELLSSESFSYLLVFKTSLVLLKVK